MPRADLPSRVEFHAYAVFRRWLASASGLAMPVVVQPDEPLAEPCAGDQVEPVGLGFAVEQPGALVRDLGVQVQAGLVDQVEPHERRLSR